jgi:hypothetical protein
VDLNRALTEVERQVAFAEANSLWLSIGFLSDGAFTPDAYLRRAEWQRQLVRDLHSLVEHMGSETTLDAAA